MAATGGSTGERGVFVWDRAEWLTILSSYARVNDWAGVGVGLGHPLPTAIVSTRHPGHQSAVVGASLRNTLVPTLRLNATDPLPDVIDQLNGFRPRLLVCYASMLAPLAEAQLSGALRIAPEKVITASEEQLPAAREAAARAWGVAVLNTYAATETATIASMCRLGALHLYEDLVIVEPVDLSYAPVPAGQIADRLLVTVLFSRTVPLIRYELDDSVRLATTACACGSALRVLESVVGRTEASLTLSSTGAGTVLVRPNVFHDSVGALAIHGWQVRRTSSGITVRVVDPESRLDLAHVRRTVRARLSRMQVSPTVTVEVERLPGLERTALGKTPLVIAEATEVQPRRAPRLSGLLPAAAADLARSARPRNFERKQVHLGVDADQPSRWSCRGPGAVPSEDRPGRGQVSGVMVDVLVGHAAGRRRRAQRVR